MQLKCRVCSVCYTAPASQRLSSLCKRCTEERKCYLEAMNAKFPFLSEGTITDTLDPLPLNSDTELQSYRLLNVPGTGSHVLGKGTYGEVWLVQHRITGDKYALKAIQRQKLESLQQMKDLRQEIDVQRRISHRNVVRVYDAMEDRENIYILMEYVDGGNLFRYIRKRKKLTEIEAYKLFRQVAAAVNFLHTNSLLHRDIKPENILLTADNTVKLTDFGCCTFCDEAAGKYPFR
eukprot:TRINITY_DN4029_c0_g1_i2.p1 TRINITY_DN4029_c0_g1~~TRINITY_DN4029_c0_g1_i2.p1  ORF type:complete len:234 (+),score=47.83 TRINITY_DN4029_c0_g1_i2:170-871(+)